MILSSVYRNATERAFDRRLNLYLRTLIAEVATPDEPTDHQFQSLGEPLFELPLSGWYWQIVRTDEKAETRASRSLWDKKLPKLEEIGVIVGDTRQEVMAALGDGSRFGATFTFIPQDEPLGLAHTVLIARDFLGDDDFVMYLGDNLLEQDLGAFVDAFESARGNVDPPAAERLTEYFSNRMPL